MEKQRRLSLKARSKVFKALGHPTRLFIVEELAGGPRCVCALTKMVGSDISTVSRHLSVLREAGVLEDQRRGIQVFYRLKVPCVLNFLSCVDAVMQARAAEQAQIV